MARIQVTESEGIYQAKIEGSHICDTGRTAAEAVGNLVIWFPHSLGLSVSVCTKQAEAELQAAVRDWQVP